jgi:ABC-type antimicrobial peptide transport system permease subunit
MVLFSGVFRMVAFGLILGGGLTFAMRAWMTSLLGVTDTNAVPLVGSALLLCGVAALATFIPAWHASHIDPMQALRSE